MREELDGYNPTRAYRAVAAFVDGELSNWYVRRARPRFWGNTDPNDAAAAFATLHESLRAVALLIAPVTPFVSDWLHRALTGRSSHTEPFRRPTRPWSTKTWSATWPTFAASAPWRGRRARR